ncbi:Methionine aminopeptidase 1B, chloroplastic [Linum perenne]
MGFIASLSHSASKKFSTSIHGEHPSFSTSSIASSFTTSPLSFSSTLCGTHSSSQRRLVVNAKRLSGLEEAMKIQRERELSTSNPTFRKRLPLRRGRVSPPLPVPDHIPKPPYVATRELPDLASEHQFHDSEGILKMKAACELAARVLEAAGKLVKPSVTTNDIDKAVHQMIIDAGAYPSPLGYGGFPKSVCTSVNECMCHGVPDSRQLQDGDIINIDVTVYLDGYHGDTSKTFLCGNVSNALKRLVKVTEECMEKGIAVCKDGASFRKIGKRISEHAQKYGYGNEEGGIMTEGQTFTIEPILTLGSTECITWPDNWTTLTADGSPAAQFEHTILITKNGADILTMC